MSGLIALFICYAGWYCIENQIKLQIGFMQHIEQAAKQSCINMADILEETMKRFNYPEYELLWGIFIKDT